MLFRSNASSPPGDYTIVVNGGTAANYTITRSNAKLTILKAPQTISFPAIPDQTAGNLPLQLSVSANSGRIPDLVVVSGPATLAGTSLTLNGVGRVVIRASLPGNANYEAAPEVERAFSNLVHAWPHRRLATELLHLAEDLGDETPKGTRVSLRLTHEDLSNLIGASRETVTLLIRKFEETGLLHREGRELYLNRERLAAYLGLEGE